MTNPERADEMSGLLTDLELALAHARDSVRNLQLHGYRLRGGVGSDPDSLQRWQEFHEHAQRLSRAIGQVDLDLLHGISEDLSQIALARVRELEKRQRRSHLRIVPDPATEAA